MNSINQDSLNDGLFVPFGLKTDRNSLDLTLSPKAQGIVKRALTRLYSMDFSKVHISGVIGDIDPNSLSVTICGENGTYRNFAIKTVFRGAVRVEAKPGFSIEDAIGHDLVGTFQSQWMTQIGNEPDYPCECEVIVMGSRLTVQLGPCE